MKNLLKEWNFDIVCIRETKLDYSIDWVALNADHTSKACWWFGIEGLL